jgi:hypothetical protein
MSYIPFGRDVRKFSADCVWQQVGATGRRRVGEAEVSAVAPRLPWAVKDNLGRNNEIE